MAIDDRGPRHLAERSDRIPPTAVAGSGPGPRRSKGPGPAVVVGGACLLAALIAGLGLVVDQGGGASVAVAGTPATAGPTTPTTAGRGTTAGTEAPAVAAARAAIGAGRATGEAVTIAFAGDVHFERGLRTALDADPARVLAGVRGLLAPADLAVVNLETAITKRGTPVTGKEFSFRAPPTAYAALKAGGVDVATVANNHGMDYGAVGLEDTLASVEAAGFPLIGAGRDEDRAYAPHRVTVKGQRIAVIGATQVLDDNVITAWTAGPTKPGLASAKRVDRLVRAVQEARASADTVAVVLHWGTEGETCPNEAQPLLAAQLAAAGADIVVGGHAHRLQGAGYQGTTFVAYGLGNFAFYATSGPGTETGVLTLTTRGRSVEAWRWDPAQIVGQLPRALTGAAAATARARFEALAGCAGLAPSATASAR